MKFRPGLFLSKLITLVILFGAAASALAASAAGTARAEVRLSAYKVIAADAASGARESLQPLKDVLPGDTIEYQAVYVNGSGQTAHDVQLTVPVPADGVVLLAVPSSPPASSASLDGSHFAALPLMRSEVLPDGRQVLREVPLAEYRALRWSLGDIPADTSRTVRARMQLPAPSASAQR